MCGGPQCRTLVVRKVAVCTEASKADVCPPWRVTRGTRQCSPPDAQHTPRDPTTGGKRCSPGSDASCRQTQVCSAHGPPAYLIP